ncbi:MAG: hypothetical protein CJBNEKGG_04431 [Prosthecobacter sp.]|nr:hypothetical protein [Prosthecobacter sp.]
MALRLTDTELARRSSVDDLIERIVFCATSDVIEAVVLVQRGQVRKAGATRIGGILPAGGAYL